MLLTVDLSKRLRSTLASFSHMSRITRAIFLGLSVLGITANCLADVARGYDALQSGDYETAVREYSASAEQGDPVAQYNLALMYDLGDGVPQNTGELMDLNQ